MAHPLDPCRPIRARTPRTNVQPPTWDGSDPAGMTMLVRCDSDLGECVRLARYLPLLTGRRATVLAECPATLAGLLGRLPGVGVFSTGTTALPADAQVMLSALPELFGTTPATVPTFTCYLRPGAALVAAWRERLRPARGGSSPYLVAVAPSTAEPDASMPFGPIPHVEVISIQEGPGAAAAARVSAPRLGKAGCPLHDLADAAAVIASVDLVIAANPVVAHLAGALGKPVWMLLPFATECSGSSAGDDTSWYPSMRLFRQPSPGDWSDVAAALSRDLPSQFPTRPSVAA